jgi:RNA polymerase sigma-70 factor (ECF subfamily)
MKAESAKRSCFCWTGSKKDKFIVQESDTTLVEAAIDGDADSFTELCRRYYPAMVAIAHSMLGDRHLAEDAAQEALAKAAFQLPQLKRKSKFAGWLAAICRNAARDIFRRTDRRQSVSEHSAVPNRSDRDKTAEVVREAIGRLPMSTRELVFLRYYDGLSYEQISKVLGISEQAINGRLRRAKKKMAGYLRREGFGEVRS